MVGGRYSQSLDIGRELEKEKEEEKEPLPCVCSPDLSKKKQETEKVEEAKAESPAEKVSEPEKQESASEAADNPEKTAETGTEAAKTSSETAETPQEMQSEPAEEPKSEENPDGAEDINEQISEPETSLKEPDPVEEDVEAIINKEIPDLKPRKSILALFFSHSWIFWVVFVVVVGGMFWIWSAAQQSAEQEKEMLPVKPVLVPLESQITIDQAPGTAAEENTSPETAVEENIADETIAEPEENATTAPVQQDLAPVEAKDDAGELAKILAEGLKI
jgi:hypothetical protein